MVKLSWKIITCISAITFLSACSPVDSVRPFNQEQAALLLKENHIFRPSMQTISLPLPQRDAWRRIDVSYQTVGTPIMLVPNGETEKQWTQSIRTQIRSYERYPSMTMRHYFYDALNDERDYCSYVDGNILEQHTDYAIYSITLGGCTNKPNQQQYGKIFNGKDAVYVVYYSWISGISADAAVKSAIYNATLHNRQ